MNEDRKTAIESFNYLPEKQLHEALTAKKNGCSNNMCAAAAGLEHEDLMYMLELGRDGHPVWQEFHKLWRRAEYLATAPVWEGVANRARNGKSSDVDLFMRHHDEEFNARKKAEIEAENPSGDPRFGKGVTINIARFESRQNPKELPADVIDVEAESV